MSIFEYDEEKEMKIIKQDSFDAGVSQGVSQGISQGIAQGISQGEESALFRLVQDGSISLRKVSDFLNISMEEAAKRMRERNYNAPAR